MRRGVPVRARVRTSGVGPDFNAAHARLACDAPKPLSHRARRVRGRGLPDKPPDRIGFDHQVQSVQDGVTANADKDLIEELRPPPFRAKLNVVPMTAPE